MFPRVTGFMVQASMITGNLTKYRKQVDGENVIRH